MTIVVYTPAGAVGAAPVQRSAAVPVLSGVAVGVLDNAKPNAALLMTRMAEELATRTGAELALVTDKGPGANAATPATDQVLDRITEEVKVVLTGSAD